MLTRIVPESLRRCIHGIYINNNSISCKYNGKNRGVGDIPHTPCEDSRYPFGMSNTYTTFPSVLRT